MRRFVVALSLVVLSACGGGGEADPELTEFFNDIAAEWEAFHVDNGHYPNPMQWAEETDLPQSELEQWNIVVNSGGEHGAYCIEGDDETGTWHYSRGDEEPSEGDCPEEGSSEHDM
jgi:hypothetical protein